MTQQEVDDIRNVLRKIDSPDEAVSQAACAELATNAVQWLTRACDEVERDLKSIKSQSDRVAELEQRLAETMQSGAVAPNATVLRVNDALNRRVSVLGVVLDAARKASGMYYDLPESDDDPEVGASSFGQLSIAMGPLRTAISAADAQVGT